MPTKKKKDEEDAPKQLTLHTCALTMPQAQKLRALLVEHGARMAPSSR